MPERLLGCPATPLTLQQAVKAWRIKRQLGGQGQAPAKVPEASDGVAAGAKAGAAALASDGGDKAGEEAGDAPPSPFASASAAQRGSHHHEIHHLPAVVEADVEGGSQDLTGMASGISASGLRSRRVSVRMSGAVSIVNRCAALRLWCAVGAPAVSAREHACWRARLRFQAAAHDTRASLPCSAPIPDLLPHGWKRTHGSTGSLADLGMHPSGPSASMAVQHSGASMAVQKSGHSVVSVLSSVKHVLGGDAMYQ